MRCHHTRSADRPLWSRLRRDWSVPERIGGAGLAVAVAAAGWPAVTSAAAFSPPCPLRWSTGVPCPACGLTTASVALLDADPATAVLANPAVAGLAAITAVMMPILAMRSLGVLAPPVPWAPGRRRLVARAAVLLAAASWLYQLNRLGVR